MTDCLRLMIFHSDAGSVLGVFTKNLVSFDEAAQLGASLGTVLRGINFDLNDFVNSKPSERVEMVLGEVADAIDEGRFNIEEDGVKFGQQISIWCHTCDHLHRQVPEEYKRDHLAPDQRLK